MLALFRHQGKKYAYDTASGEVIALSALGFKLLGALEPPLSPTLPTSLRYEFAMYDADTLREEYLALYALFAEGRLLATATTRTPPRTEDTALAAAALAAAE